MRLPPVLLALDIIGTALLGLGIFGYLSSEAVTILGFIDLGALALPLIILGAFLMAPLLVHVLRQALAGRR